MSLLCLIISWNPKIINNGIIHCAPNSTRSTHNTCFVFKLNYTRKRQSVPWHSGYVEAVCNTLAKIRWSGFEPPIKIFFFLISIYSFSFYYVFMLLFFFVVFFFLMEILSCHNNESTWAKSIINTSFVEAHIMNVSTKFQLHPLYGFKGEDFWIFFFKFSLLVAMATNQIHRFGQNSFIFVENYSINIFVKLLSKYLQCDTNKGLLSLFPLKVYGNFKLPKRRKPISNDNKNTIL